MSAFLFQMSCTKSEGSLGGICISPIQNESSPGERQPPHDSCESEGPPIGAQLGVTPRAAELVAAEKGRRHEFA